MVWTCFKRMKPLGDMFQLPQGQKGSVLSNHSSSNSPDKRVEPKVNWSLSQARQL